MDGPDGHHRIDRIHVAHDNNNVRIIPFCVPFHPSCPFLAEDEGFAPVEDPGFGVVGTIALRGNSAVIWFGWGSIEEDDGKRHGSSVSAADEKTLGGFASVGYGKPSMGPLAVSMPPAVRGGGAQMEGEAPTSQLLGGGNEEDMLLGQQAAARIARRVGWPLFVSCSLGGARAAGGPGGGGRRGGVSDTDMIASLSEGHDGSLLQRAAALAEREVSRILLEEKAKLLAQKCTS